MTPITSSAASDTESARKRTPGRPGATGTMTASPLPSPRCTSRSTTSGSVSRISGTASATLPASPTMFTFSPSSPRTPARNNSWSSTRTTRTFTGFSSRGSPGQDELDLGAVARRRDDGGAAARAAHPPLDRLGEAAPVGRDSRAVEAGAAVADEDAHALVVALGIDGDLVGARELRGVRHRLARGEHDGPQLLGERAVAAARELDAHAVRLLDLVGGGGECAAQRLAGRGTVAVEPAAQLTLLPPREGRDPARLLRVPLDQRQRLEHRVVDARRDLGALLGPDSCGAFRVALERE